MKKSFVSFLLVAACIQGMTAQTFKGEVAAADLPKLDHHYQDEPDAEKVVNPAAWVGLQGMHAAFGSTDELYFRREVPMLEPGSRQFSTVVWKGERVNIQVLVWSADELTQVRLQSGELKRADGRQLNMASGAFRLVRYVLSNYPYGARDAVCGDSPYTDGYLMPDRFEGFDRFDLPASSVRPVWFTLDIPQDAAPGVYSGMIRVQSEQQAVELPVSIRVQDQVLPRPSEWKHRLDLWQNPWVVAWRNNLTPWSEEHKVLLKQHLKLYADAGGTYITTYAVHSPWSDNSYMIEGGMIEWIKRTDGSWAFDYSIFDTYVALAMECGIKRAITLYTPIPWGNRFRYLDEATGNYVTASWSPEESIFTTQWNLFLTDLKQHLKQKGWFDITYLGINENEMNQTLAAIRIIKAHGADWRITYAGNWHKELDLLLDDYSFLYGEESTPADVKARRERGTSTTYYVCCNPPYPNNFVFSPPIEGRWISWYSAAFGYDGFLRWAYDAWPEDPNRDARHGSWAAGDCYMMYPGGNSCIRWEKLREGIVDYEKIRILREKAAASTNKLMKQTLSELDKHLAKFVTETVFEESSLRQDVERGRTFVNKLSDQAVQ